MKIIRNQNIKDTSVLLKYRVIENINFLNKDDCKFIVESANHNINTIKKWYDIIGIQYSNIEIIANNYIIYTVNNESLMLADLSSGERLLLFLLACKNVNEQNILVRSLFERLGSRLTDVVCNNLTDYEGLTVISYAGYPLILESHEVEQI